MGLSSRSGGHCVGTVAASETEWCCNSASTVFFLKNCRAFWSARPVKPEHRKFLRNTVVRNECAVAALKADGSVQAWGEEAYGGDCSGEGLTLGVKCLFYKVKGFAAWTADGSVVAWGGGAHQFRPHDAWASMDKAYLCSQEAPIATRWVELVVTGGLNGLCKLCEQHGEHIEEVIAGAVAEAVDQFPHGASHDPFWQIARTQQFWRRVLRTSAVHAGAKSEMRGLVRAIFEMQGKAGRGMSKAGVISPPTIPRGASDYPKHLRQTPRLRHCVCRVPLGVGLALVGSERCQRQPAAVSSNLFEAHWQLPVSFAADEALVPILLQMRPLPHLGTPAVDEPAWAVMVQEDTGEIVKEHESLHQRLVQCMHAGDEGLQTWLEAARACL